MERLQLDTNALLTASLTEKLEDEHWRDDGRPTLLKRSRPGGATTPWSAIARAWPSSASGFDCQVAIVHAAAGQWVFAVSKLMLARIGRCATSTAVAWWRGGQPWLPELARAAE